ncbi:cobalt-precorrin-6A reductase [Bradyrhizobium sp.]|uniref:cobalt-precorrin-6A reductase n=1 Tax=Bradyrhizobium sp. TaxID=376 RepID=UPI002603D1CD|nr:cobalt-precorrin-6A reductase [Bradyrhizobium sp.]
MRVLILGGTSEANRLAAEVAAAGLDAIYSYAGRTQVPVNQPLPTRIGGFGGADGLADLIRLEEFTHVVDATHPFATEISRNALTACAATATPLVALERKPWIKTADDRWIDVDDIAAAVAALPKARTNIFLAIGRQHVAPFAAMPQHAYTLRFIDAAGGPLPLPDADLLVSRGPFTLGGELELMRSRHIEWIVARNSGGEGARAKIDAARELRLSVIMIKRPQLPDRLRVESVADVLQWLTHPACLGA